MENTKILYTSIANYLTLNDIPDLIEHLSHMQEQYDYGIFCNKDIVSEFGPCSVALKDESLPILTIKNIDTIPLFNREQEVVMDKIYGEFIDYNDETDEEYLNYHVSDHAVKKQLENVFSNYDNQSESWSFSNRFWIKPFSVFFKNIFGESNQQEFFKFAKFFDNFAHYYSSYGFFFFLKNFTNIRNPNSLFVKDWVDLIEKEIL